MQKLFEIFF